MQRDSSRPWFLRQRIMGGRGHLSNEQAYEAVRNIMALAYRSDLRVPDHIVLLHRSRQCNCPHILRSLFESDEQIRHRLTLAEQETRTDWLRAGQYRPDEQLRLAWT
jgi:phosphoribosyl 1,2-cyclic phosphodiesterase